MKPSSIFAFTRLVILALGGGVPPGPLLVGQVVTIDTSAAARRQVIDGFGTCLSGSEGLQSWWQQLYFDDLGASMVRVDLTPNFVAPYSNNAYNSPAWGNAGPGGNYTRAYTNASDYGRVFNGVSTPIAVMGPNLDTNAAYFSLPVTFGTVAQAGVMRRLQLGDFKLFGSLWSPAPWVKIGSGNTYSGSSFGLPAKGTPWPFIWLGNFAGGKLDVSGAPLAVFDDASQGGAGPTSALTQFARCTAAYVRAFQRAYQVHFYAISLQNELNFEEFYNSATYPLSSQYIAALKAVRAMFNQYPDLAGIQLMGPEDLMGGDPYSLWQYGGGSTTVHKNLQYLQNIAADPVASAGLGFFCIHGYDSDGVTASGATPTSWAWWLNGWTSSPAAGLPGNVKGTAAYGKKSWMTETSGESPAWLSPTNGFPNQGAWSIALKIHQALAAGQQSAWAYWQFTDGNPAGTSTLTDAAQLSGAAKYVAAKHFFKFIRPNAVRVSTTVAGAPNLNASAYLAAASNALTVVLVNSDSNSVNAQIQVPALPVGLVSFQSFVSGANLLWSSNSVAVAGGAVTVSVPAYGILTLFGQTAVPPQPPAIMQWPQSTNLSAGATARFSVAVNGGAPLSFQWLFDGLPIPGATGTTLLLTNVQSYQTGQYAVQVTNAAGSITSLSASLVVTGPGTLATNAPTILATNAAGLIHFSFPANSGRIYSWLTSTDLYAWTVLTQFVCGASPAQAPVTNSATVPVRYYRVSSP